MEGQTRPARRISFAEAIKEAKLAAKAGLKAAAVEPVKTEHKPLTDLEIEDKRRLIAEAAGRKLAEARVIKAQRAAEKLEAKRLKEKADADKLLINRAKEKIVARRVKKFNDDEHVPTNNGFAKSSARDKRFETIKQDLSQLIKVQIDEKTVVYMKPGDDQERIRAKYKKKPLKSEDKWL